MFQGKHISDKSDVAIKQVDKNFINRNASIKLQLENEISILKKLSHPNIVKFIDLLENENFFYIITEFCEQGDLKDQISSRNILEREAFSIIG